MPSPERPSPDRRIVLVTGAANGIGWATARRFAAAGDIVALADIDIAGATARLPSLPGTGHFAIPADLGDPAATEGHFCGRSPKEGSPYCEAHARKAYQPQQQRREKDKGRMTG